jgi:hypothetical protein
MGVEFGLAKFAQNTYCDFPVQNYGLLPQRLAQVVVTFHYLSPYYAVQGLRLCFGCDKHY